MALSFLVVIPLIYIFIVLFTGGELPFSYEVLQKIHFSVMFLYLVAIAAYIHEVYRNEGVPTEKKALWAAFLLLGGPIAQMAFFWHYVAQRQVTTKTDAV